MRSVGLSIPSPSVKARLTGLVALLVTGGCFVILFSRIEWRGVLAALAEARWDILPLSVALSLVGNCWLNVVRWRLFLGGLGWPIGGPQSRVAKLGGIPFKALLPFQSGEALRILYCHRQVGIPPLATAASIILEYAWTIGTLLAIILIGGIVSGLNPHGVTRTALVLLATGGLALGLFRLPPVRRLGRRTVRSLIGEAGSADPEEPLHPPWGLRRTVSIVAISALVMGLKLLNFGLIFYALGVRLSLAYDLVLASAVYLVGFLPISFFGLGTREAATVVFLSGLAPANILLAGAMLISLIEFILPLPICAFWSRHLLVGLSSGLPPSRDLENLSSDHDGLVSHG
jgi:uncharacterized membrane protein YbhN (UPF0104 family)